MDLRAEKIAQARRKLKEHQEKKTVQKEEYHNRTIQNNQYNISQNKNVSSAMGVQQLNINDSIPVKDSNGKNIPHKVSDLNVTEILISNTTQLETQINKLTEKLKHLESIHALEISAHNSTKQQIFVLESELKKLSNKYAAAIEQISDKDSSITNLKNVNIKLTNENYNLTEQFEFTKTLLTSKESDIAELHDKITSYENQLEVVKLQIQQLTNNTSTQLNQTVNNSEELEALLKKNTILQQNIEALEKERNQTNSHYEHYVRDLNEQLRTELTKNEGLAKEVQQLCNRENSLIEQISEMEIHIQNIHIQNENISKQKNDIELQKLYEEVQGRLIEANTKYEELQKQYKESLSKIQELNQIRAAECDQDKFYIDKLNADITSDKIAAQKATEQNRKLKSNMEELEQVVVKMGNDKLELTEMWTHEKQLNMGLALKLAEIEENATNMSKQLKAKDEEMIRLQNENRDIKIKYEKTLEQIIHTEENETIDKMNNSKVVAQSDDDHSSNHEEVSLITSKPLSNIENKNLIAELDRDNFIPKEDAMNKLQERFLNIMDQVANLSDEKHRLEHIILQLQNETDTICEYVALYQQQRSLLKKREEERGNQLKFYQIECDKLKRHLEELRGLLLRFSSDHELQSLLKEERRNNDLNRVNELLEKLENCSLINPKFKHLDMNVFYPCSCCSGQIIEI